MRVGGGGGGVGCRRERARTVRGLRGEQGKEGGGGRGRGSAPRPSKRGQQQGDQTVFVWGVGGGEGRGRGQGAARQTKGGGQYYSARSPARAWHTPSARCSCCSQPALPAGLPIPTRSSLRLRALLLPAPRRRALPAGEGLLLRAPRRCCPPAAQRGPSPKSARSCLHASPARGTSPARCEGRLGAPAVGPVAPLNPPLRTVLAVLPVLRGHPVLPRGVGHLPSECAALRAHALARQVCVERAVTGSRRALEKLPHNDRMDAAAAPASAAFNTAGSWLHPCRPRPQAGRRTSSSSSGRTVLVG